MTFIKLILQIRAGSSLLTIKDGIVYNGEIDMDNLYGTLNFELPYKLVEDGEIPVYSDGEFVESGNVHRLERDMFVTLYYIELEFNRDVTINEMSKIFDGKILDVNLVKTKLDRTYAIKCEALLSFANDRPAFGKSRFNKFSSNA